MKKEINFLKYGGNIRPHDEINNEVIISFCGKDYVRFINAIKTQARQEIIEKIEARIKARLGYCQKQNGLPYCKNCGLAEEDIDLLKE